MPTMTNQETGETKEISMEELMEMLRSGKGSVRQEVHHADGSVTSSVIFGNDVGDGVDRSVNLFGTMNDILMPAIVRARKIKEADPDAEKLFSLDNTGADYEVTVDDTATPVMHIVLCTNDKVTIRRYIRDERKTVGTPLSEESFTLIDGKLSATLEEAREGKGMFLIAAGVIETRKLLEERGLLQQLKELDNRSSGVVVKADGDDIITQIVRGHNRPDLPCLLFGGMLGQSVEDAVMMRPYMDELMGQAIRSGMSVEEMISAAESGDPDCMESLAQAYVNGDGVDQDFQQSASWWEKLAETGNAIAQFNIGLYYAKGCGVPRDFEKAAEWMKKAAENGDEDAPGPYEMYSAAADNLKKAEAGDAAAQAEMAKLYMQIGGSLDQYGSGDDYKESFEWAKKSADQGNADGMYCLGLCYNHGRGTDADLKKAAAVYEKAAKQGHAPSQWNLAVCYMNGQGVPQDSAEALVWAYQSADQGYELAMEGLEMSGKTVSQIIERFSEAGPYSTVKLEGTQYEGRAERCEHFRAGMELQYKIIKDKDGYDALECFSNGRTVGLISRWVVSEVIVLLKLERASLKILVKGCIPKSMRGARARNADVSLKLELTEKKPETPEERAARLEKERIAEEKAKREAEERRRREEEARKKAEEEKRKQQEKERQEEEARKKEIDQYHTEYMNWEKRCEEILRERKAYVEEKVSQRQTEIREAVQQTYEAEIEKLRKELSEQTDRESTATSKLATLGVFKFSEKKAQKAIIEDARNRISSANDSIARKEREYKDRLSAVVVDARKETQKFEVEAIASIPLPEEPAKPAAVLLEEKKELERQRKREEEERHRIELKNKPTPEEAEALSYLGSYGTTAQEVANYMGISNQKASVLLIGLIQKGKAERYVERRVAYYRAL